MSNEAVKLTKNNISLIEYSDTPKSVDSRLFLQCGVAGFFASKKELEDIYSILNYYMNIDSFQECYISIGKETISAIPMIEDED